MSDPMLKMLISLARPLRQVAFLALDSLSRVVPVRKRSVSVIIRLDAVGDLFVWLQSGASDVVNYARRSTSRVVLVANAIWADYARQLALWDDVISVDVRRFMRNPLYRLKLFLMLRRLGPSLLLQPRAARVFLQEDAIARVSGASLKIGNSGFLANMSPRMRALGNKYYDRLIDVDQSLATHEIFRNQQFVCELTGQPATPYKISSSRFEVQERKIVAVVVGAGWIGRVWPIRKLTKFLEQVKRVSPGSRFVLLGAGRLDASLAKQLQNEISFEVENRVGQTTLAQYVEAIAESSLVICNESSAFHIAMAFQKKVVCFLGGGHFGWFAPYPEGQGRNAKVLSMHMDCFGCGWNCIYPATNSGAVACVDSISIESAIEAVRALSD